MPYFHHDQFEHFGHHGFAGGGHVVVVVALLVVLAAVLFRRFSGRGFAGRTHHHAHHASAPAALEILQARLAKGEITVEEFETTKKALLS